MFQYDQHFCNFMDKTIQLRIFDRLDLSLLLSHHITETISSAICGLGEKYIYFIELDPRKSASLRQARVLLYA